MISMLFSMYRPAYVSTLVYMLQSTEYQVKPYLKWYWRTNDFSMVAKRRSLDRTRAAKLLELALSLGIITQIFTGLALIFLGWRGDVQEGIVLGLAVIVAYPVVWAHLITFPLLLGRWFIIKPRERRLIVDSEKIFKNHKGTKIAVAGSYGKTSMKELLATVLSAGKEVAATPANKNVASSHAVFAQKLSGKEDVIIVEYGEASPGDVERFCKTTHPNIGVITGIAPAHLDHYSGINDAATDIFSLAHYLHDENVYVNGDSKSATDYIKPGHHVYTTAGVDNLKVDNVKVSVDGTEFKLSQGSTSQVFRTKLLGRHNIGPLVAAIAIAQQLGLSKTQIREGVSNTKPYEHRMQPYRLAGAWVIDDTYNGNIEGIRAGLALLNELKAKRKIYVTPGLVDQGVETIAVHKEMARLIADVNPDKTVLMSNSATKIISDELRVLGYTGQVITQSDPLGFYENLEHFVAHGDIVLMQNDWTDNYN